MIYLDHHAATPLSPTARAALEEALGAWGNPASVHAEGRRARAVLERARDRVASALVARAADVILTGGGTEACNLGVLGLGRGARRVVTTAVEHPAVAQAVRRLEAAGAEVVRIGAPSGAVPDPEACPAALGPETLVAMQWVNHETGTILPVASWAAACRATGARLFVDGTQALGKLAVSVELLDADALAVAAHKIGGPAGAGALWLRRGCEVEPVLAGGAQERGRRPGSPDVLAAAGFGGACLDLAARRDSLDAIGRRRDRLEAELLALGAVRNAADAPRVATVSSVAVPGWTGDALVAALDIEGVCAASGAACSSGVSEPSPVIAAMHPEEAWRASSTLRLSLGPETTDEDVERAMTVIRGVLARAETSGRF